MSTNALEHCTGRAAFDTRTGKVYARTEVRKRQVEFIAFLSQLEQELPVAKTRVYLVMDNLSVHKGKQVQVWLKAHPRFLCYFTPVHCSWMNQVEQWFSILQRKRLSISDFSSLSQLADRLMAFVLEGVPVASGQKPTLRQTHIIYI
jgi:transposase